MTNFLSIFLGGPIGPQRKIGKKMVMFLSHGLLFGTPRQKKIGVMGYFWTPRQTFSRVMGFFFGPLGKTFLESWASFLDPWAMDFGGGGEM